MSRATDLEWLQTLAYLHRVLSNPSRPSAARSDAAAKIEELIVSELRKIVVV